MPISDTKITTACCGLSIAEKAAYSGEEVRFAFAVNGNDINEVGIMQKFGIGYKWESCIMG